MKIKLQTKEGLKEFDSDFNMVTHEMYYSTFSSDILIDAIKDLTVLGGMLSRSFLIRVYYAMIKTVDHSFMGFIPFLQTLEDDVIQFFEDLDQELVELIVSKATARAEKELSKNDTVKN